MTSINAMDVYINKLAEKAREQCEEQGIIGNEQYSLDFERVRAVVEYYGGELERFDSKEAMLKEYSGVKGNSFMLKTSEEAFKIGFVEEITLDILHELGHAFLEFENMDVGDIRCCGDTNIGLKEVEASKWARAFLMPMWLFQKCIVKNSIKGGCDIRGIANDFQIDESQVIIHGRETNIWE